MSNIKITLTESQADALCTLLSSLEKESPLANLYTALSVQFSRGYNYCLRSSEQTHTRYATPMLRLLTKHEACMEQRAGVYASDDSEAIRQDLSNSLLREIDLGWNASESSCNAWTAVRVGNAESYHTMVSDDLDDLPTFSGEGDL